MTLTFTFIPFFIFYSSAWSAQLSRPCNIFVVYVETYALQRVSGENANIFTKSRFFLKKIYITCSGKYGLHFCKFSRSNWTVFARYKKYKFLLK